MPATASGASSSAGRQEAEKRERALKQEAIEKEQRQSLETTAREQNLLRDAALRQKRLQKDAQSQRSSVFAREKVLLQTKAEVEQRNLTWEKAYIDADLKQKQLKISVTNEIEKQ